MQFAKPKKATESESECKIWPFVKSKVWVIFCNLSWVHNKNFVFCFLNHLYDPSTLSSQKFLTAGRSSSIATWLSVIKVPKVAPLYLTCEALNFVGTCRLDLDDRSYQSWYRRLRFLHLGFLNFLVCSDFTSSSEYSFGVVFLRLLPVYESFAWFRACSSAGTTTTNIVVKSWIPSL